jgi:ABC-type microcin C transport system permease subunit YejE
MLVYFNGSTNYFVSKFIRIFFCYPHIYVLIYVTMLLCGSKIKLAAI